MMKTQLNVRLNPVCVELIKLERKSIPGCRSDGEALESIDLPRLHLTARPAKSSGKPRPL